MQHTASCSDVRACFGQPEACIGKPGACINKPEACVARLSAMACACLLPQVFSAVVRHVDWGVVRCLVIAGPGFTKDQFRKYLEEEAVRRDAR